MMNQEKKLDREGVVGQGEDADCVRNSPEIHETNESSKLNFRSMESVSHNLKELKSPRKKMVRINLFKLPADGRARIWIRDYPTSDWITGDPNVDLVGLAVETASRNEVMKLGSFIITGRDLIFNSYDACNEIAVTIWVRCAERGLRGYVDLPLGTSVVFKSEADSTSLVGFSSFTLDLPV